MLFTRRGLVVDEIGWCWYEGMGRVEEEEVRVVVVDERTRGGRMSGEAANEERH